MTIENYGLQYKRITLDDIELLRQWRNSESINQFMEYRGYISPAKQLKWFNETNTIHNHYFIVTFRGRYLGMANLRNVDWEKSQAEPGGFVALENHRASRIAAKCVIFLFEIAFNFMKVDTLSSTVVKSNERAIQTNISLGGEVDYEDEGLYRFIISKNRFTEKGARFIDVVHRVDDAYSFFVSFSPDDIQSGFRDKLLNQINYRHQLLNNQILVEN